MASSDPDLSGLRSYLAVVKRRKWMILAVTVLVCVSALVLSLLQSDVYQAQARLLVQPGQSIFATSNNGSAVDPAFIQTEIQILRSEAVRKLVRERLGSAPPVTASVVAQTAVVEVRSQSASAAQAARATNAYVDAYLEIRRQQAVDAFDSVGRELQGRIDVMQQEIDKLGDRLASLPDCGSPPAGTCVATRESVQRDRDALVTQMVPFKQRREQLQVDASVTNAGTQVVARATPPKSPIQPAPVRNALLGLAMGLVGGVALAVLVEYLDESINDKDDLQRSIRDIPVLGLIPDTPIGHRDSPAPVSLVDPGSAAAEAYRILRTSIHFRLHRPGRLLQVTSPGPGEGKTSTVADLGLALSRAGDRVLMVGCDLRRPQLHALFGMPNNRGFMSVLMKDCSLADAIQNVPGEDRLMLLGSGPLPPDPAAFLASPEAGNLLASLRSEADIIVIDTPPILPVTDAVVVATQADAILLVARRELTTRKQVARALEHLEQVDASVIGAVLVGVVDDGVSRGGGAYYSTYSTQAAPEDAETVVAGPPSLRTIAPGRNGEEPEDSAVADSASAEDAARE